MGVWYYLRTAPGDLRPLTADDMEAFLRGELPLPADGERWVQYVGLSVGYEGDVPMDVERVWFARCRVREDGTLDQAHMLEIANTKVDVQRRLRADELVEPSPEDVLIDASAHFEARRVQHASTWRPEEGDVVALRRLVNERAGWAII